jgi:hypothetical protein
VKLRDIVLSGLKLGIAIAVMIVEQILNERGKERKELKCPNCGVKLEDKGNIAREIKSIIGRLKWHRKVLRCPNKCKIGQIAPLDEGLGLKPNQRISEELKEVSCALAVFLPFGIASLLLKMLTGVEVNAGSIWNWVQSAGRDAKLRIEEEIEEMGKGEEVKENNIEAELKGLPLVIGGDGVMVPFRPKAGSSKGKTVWKEVKVGIFARIGKRITRTNKEVSIIIRRYLVAVLGKIDVFKSHMRLAGIKEGVFNSKLVVWLSDGGKGYWGVFNDCFSNKAQGILDFYHSAQNLWKAASSLFDGRTKKAQEWFTKARRVLRIGKIKGLMSELRKGANSNDLPDSVRKTLNNVFLYLQEHSEHIKYNHYKELGLPIGSGMVESTCKWLIQQRFKCVGMRWSEDGFNNLLYLRLAWVNESFSQLFHTPNS